MNIRPTWLVAALLAAAPVANAQVLRVETGEAGRTLGPLYQRAVQLEEGIRKEQEALSPMERQKRVMYLEMKRTVVRYGGDVSAYGADATPELDETAELSVQSMMITAADVPGFNRIKAAPEAEQDVMDRLHNYGFAVLGLREASVKLDSMKAELAATRKTIAQLVDGMTTHG